MTEPGGRILELPGGELQVVEKGPRDASPIVLIHCFTCAINWWDGMIPLLDRDHRVVAIDLLGHGGSEKPASGYSIENQADLVAQALGRLGRQQRRGRRPLARRAGGDRPGRTVAAAGRPGGDHRQRPTTPTATSGLIGELAFKPVIGEALWRVKPDFAIKNGLEVAFAPGFDVPDAFVEDVKRMTYSAYTRLARCLRRIHQASSRSPSAPPPCSKPLLAIMGAEEQIASDPREALAAYSDRSPVRKRG